MSIRRYQPNDDLEARLYEQIFGEADRFTDVFVNQGQPYPRQSSSESFYTQLYSYGAPARRWQEMEGGFENMSIHDSHGSRTENRGTSHEGNSNLAGHQDGVDTDNMTYEQMSQLGQTVGSVNKGLSKEQISKLPTHKYKGSSKKKGTSADNNKECAICKAEYSSGDMLITLPCTHQYHSDCIKKWLTENKIYLSSSKEAYIISLSHRIVASAKWRWIYEGLHGRNYSPTSEDTFKNFLVSTFKLTS